MKKYILLLLMLSTTDTIFAQEKDITYKYWFTLGLGVINTSINLSYNFSLGNNFYNIGYLKRGGLLKSTGRDGYLYNTINISIGRRLQSKWFQTSLFAGPSYTFGEKRVPALHQYFEKYNTVGLDTKFQLSFRPANEIGIGLGLYGNLNFYKNYSGININLNIGNGK